MARLQRPAPASRLQRNATQQGGGEHARATTIAPDNNQPWIHWFEAAHPAENYAALRKNFITSTVRGRRGDTCRIGLATG